MEQLEKKVVDRPFHSPADRRRPDQCTAQLYVDSPRGQFMASGFIVRYVGERFCLVTNNHVIAEEKELQFATVYLPNPSEDAGRSIVRVNPAAYFHTSPELDVTIVAVKVEDLSQEQRFLAFDLQRPAIADPIYLEVWQHPLGIGLMSSTGKVIPIPDQEPHKVFYSLSTDYGSSGGPVLLDGTTLFAVHCGRDLRQPWNYGVRIVAVLSIFPRSTVQPPAAVSRPAVSPDPQAEDGGTAFTWDSVVLPIPREIALGNSHYATQPDMNNKERILRQLMPIDGADGSQQCRATGPHTAADIQDSLQGTLPARQIPPQFELTLRRTPGSETITAILTDRRDDSRKLPTTLEGVLKRWRFSESYDKFFFVLQMETWAHMMWRSRTVLLPDGRGVPLDRWNIAVMRIQGDLFVLHCVPVSPHINENVFQADNVMLFCVERN